jgi:hypothetical protein
MEARTSQPNPVRLSELIEAFDFVNASPQSESAAYIRVATGEVLWVSSDAGVEDVTAEELDGGGLYLAVPDKRELDLGRRLVFAFVGQELPGDLDAVAEMFRGRGAYRRWKAFLGARGVLQKWYEFEARSVEAALRDWCRENGIAVVAS